MHSKAFLWAVVAPIRVAVGASLVAPICVAVGARFVAPMCEAVEGVVNESALETGVGQEER